MLNDLRYILEKTVRPSVYFESLRKQNQLDEWFPELKALIGVPQSEEWHQEGDVWAHTMLVIDEAGWLRMRSSDPFRFMLAALCHDMGKAVCTQIGDKVHAYDHEEAGVPIARAFLDRLGTDDYTKDYVCSMVRLHMKPHHAFYNDSRVKKTNKMFFEAPDPYDLILLAISDSSGRIPHPDTNPQRHFLLERYDEYKKILEMPYVSENDLLEMGLQHGTALFEDAASYSHKLRMACVSREDAFKQTSSYIRKKQAGLCAER